MTLEFGVTFDYLCPWARNVNEHVSLGLRDGADWSVRFMPYSLRQGRVEEGDTPIWERADADEIPGILALKVGLVVRDAHPEHFLDVHDALFAVRHDHGEDNRDPDMLAKALSSSGIDDADAVLDAARSDDVLARLRREHEQAVDDHNVWGVPTIVGTERAVFVRVLDRPDGDASRARRRIEDLVGLVEDAVEIHEFKQTVLAK